MRDLTPIDGNGIGQLFRNFFEANPVTMEE
jgi:hypothetical protein